MSATIGWPSAGQPTSHTKMISFPEIKPVNIWHFPIGWLADISSPCSHHKLWISAIVCVWSGLQITSWDGMVSGEMIDPISRGNDRSEMTPKSGWKEYIPSWEGLDVWMERWLQTPPKMVCRSELWTLAHVVSVCENNFCSARGMWLFNVPGAHEFCSARGTNWL